ncbi:PhoH family protein [Candidatus Saccharibacteria bacterium]|nr:PhoH family protein [Candidatus Saccharibacteria bacterium]
MSKRKRTGKGRYSRTNIQTKRQAQEKEQKREMLQLAKGCIGEPASTIVERVEGTVEPITTADEDPDISIQPESSVKNQRWYVLDTNLILSCVDIIYDEQDEDWHEPIGFKPNLENAHLIIPYVVFEELNHIKEEATRRGMIARIAFDRLIKFFPNSGRTLREIMNLSDPIPTGLGDQHISLLPLHRNFSKILPWVPDRDDNDGWIAVTALAATMIREGLPVDGSIKFNDEEIDMLDRSNEKKDVILLTNDNSLLSKADDFAVHVKSYSFKKRPPFTGCREIVVPREMFQKFYHEDKLSREDFEYFLPEESSLVANEYIIMKLRNEDEYPRGYFSDGIQFKNIARYHIENDTLYPLRFIKHEGKEPANAGIACYYDAMNDDNIHVVNVTGAAGTGKTFQAITHAIKEVKAGKYARIILIPSRAAKNPLGALPGGPKQKMEPLISSAKDAIRSYLAATPEFREKREALRRHGDNDDDRDEIVEEKKNEDRNQKRDRGQKNRGGKNNHGKNRGNNHNSRDARRTLGDFTGSFNDLDFGSNDYAPEDFGIPHSKKKGSKGTFYPGKSEKKSGDGGERKMTYNEMLDQRVNYLFYRYFTCMPYEEAQGHSFDDAIIILDEFQRTLIDDADTLITRPGKNAKLLICGDIDQIHESSAEKQFKNGLNYSIMLFFDWEGCANVHLTTNMRGDIARVMTANRRKVRRRMGQI